MEGGGVQTVQLVVVLLLVFVVVFGALARRLETSYPIVLLIAGLALSLVPGIPRVNLDPDFVFFVFLPPLLYAVFRFSERSLGEWLGKGFDADTAMLELINSGRFADSPVGRYLYTLKDKFEGPLVADLLCYLRLHTELSMRAKGILMMRESGFEVPVNAATREMLSEMRYLEKSIGRTGVLAIQPMLGMSQKDLWQLYMLGK